MKLRILRRTKMANTEDMRPPSMDDYTDTETTGRPVPTIPVDTTTGEAKEELTIRKMSRALGLDPYVGPWNLSRQAAEDRGYTSFDRARMLATAAGKRAMALFLFDDDAVTDAYEVSQEVGNNLDWGDDVRSTFRHLLLGGLVESKQGQKYINEEKESGLDLESIIDRNNNLFGKSLREKYPDREEFIQAALATAVALGDGEKVEPLDGRNLRLSVEGKYDEIHSDAAMMEGLADIEERGENESLPIPPTRPEKFVEPDPMKSTDDYTPTQKKGGLLSAQEGVIPMTKATSNPTGNKPVKSQKVPNKVGRPQQSAASGDPRDAAIAKVSAELGKAKSLVPAPTPVPPPTQAKKGTVKIDEELEKGTKPEESTGMSVMIGLGAPDMDYQDAAEGDPPPGATKEEVADDQMVLMSEGELVVPANVVRFHGLATYEGMRREALAGLQDMESDGQISYVEPETTKKTYQGGIMRAQKGITPLPNVNTQFTVPYQNYQSTPVYQGATAPAQAASAQYIVNPNQGMMAPIAGAGTYGAQPVSQYTPTYQTTPGIIPKVVAPNIGHYLPEDQRMPWMSPDKLPTGTIPGISPTPTPTPDPIPDPTPTPDPTPDPDPISEDATKYIESGAGQAELAKVQKALKDAETQRDIDRRNTQWFSDRESALANEKETGKLEAYGTFNPQNFLKQEGLMSQDAWDKSFKKIGEDAKADFRKQFGPATPLNAWPSTKKHTADTFPGFQKHVDMPLANYPASIMESFRSPAVAALRSTHAGQYQPGEADVDQIAKASGMTPDGVRAYYEMKGMPITSKYGQYSDLTMKAIEDATATYAKDAQGKSLGTYSDYEKTKRRREAKIKNAKDWGFWDEGITRLSSEEANAYANINKSLNDGQYDPNGLMGVKQYADFKKTGLTMNQFFKLSRAEQSFYAAARTGDTVESWVINSMKEGTTAAFDGMNAANDSSVLRSDKYEIAADQQYKPEDAADDAYEVSVHTYWQSPEGQKKAEELGVDVG